ncbi:D-glycero-beta-D-manno-heptose 1,7-bisphosphate 7-phosphatase [Acidovorax sp. SRB_24]|uniref:D-glycero-beta-D-manno-heptose 1,7-bisphosphate 7-phosphatase n=1 Tax=Acidovorax sp. SRB_24 TaxID=1962700 RepID=UPI00145C66C4|nr:D-glycero-beta-D-manno-heptose 1,7-bisphosphate 7-phosphatase [Acidovorax sp. SRB_24]NMM78992.1 D-glycero-beta-D-manno-heptose-1,7-bisphosphate 7-phosphatase [Acidovorax sp. SRB_24]
MKIAILDRDGTINALGDEPFIASPDDWKPVPGALAAIARLNHGGWRVVIATNQPGLGRGLFDVAALNAIHGGMHRQLAAMGGRIDAVFYCPHAPDEACHCRKPATGLFEQICERYGVDAHEVCVVGSCIAHLQAGAAFGAPLHLVCTGAAAGLDPAAALPPEWPPGTRAHASLAAFAEELLAHDSALPAPPPLP